MSVHFRGTNDFTRTLAHPSILIAYMTVVSLAILRLDKLRMCTRQNISECD